MTWLREAISDEHGQGDAAYISILSIAVTLVGTVVFLCMMSVVSYARCTHVVDVSYGKILATSCQFDPQPLALGIAAAIGAFGAPIIALAGYMAATRRREKDKP